MSRISLTEQQELAVTARSKCLLVAAAAGSGKTRVLVERLVSALENPEHPLDLDSFLILTFTKAAANEMRSRIVAEISARLARCPQNRHLRRQMSHIHRARIGTLHSFCSDLLRQYAGELNLQPDYRVGDESECQKLRHAALDAVLERRYSEAVAGDAFSQLVDLLSSERDDQHLADTLLDLHTRMRALPNASAWQHSILAEYERYRTVPAQDSRWAMVLVEYARIALTHHLTEIKLAQAEISADAKMSDVYFDEYSRCLSDIEAVLSALDTDWDQTVSSLKQTSFPRMKSLTKYDDKPKAARIQNVRKAWKDSVAGLCKVISGSALDHQHDVRQLCPVAAELFQLIGQLDEEFSFAKRARNICDFADLELFTASLLIGADGKPTDVALTLSASLAEVMVDEYQDISPLQDMIIGALSADCRQFLVGDIKQSIYRFRLADPTIFLAKYNSWPDYTGDDQPAARINLNSNFRSRPEILDAVNHVFERIMTADAGEMDYGENERLVTGTSEPDNGIDAVELNILDVKLGLSSAFDEEGGDSLGDEPVERIAAEAHLVAKRLRDLIDSGFEIPCADGRRPVLPGDCCILLRSPASRIRYYERALAACGLTLAASADDLFQTAEISVLMSLLSIIDNPRRDVELISVLRSPVYGFSDDYLAQMKTRSGGDSFYEVVARASDRGDVNARQFLAELDYYRKVAVEISADSLITLIFNRTGMLGIYSAMFPGNIRRANLLRLHSLACEFEKTGSTGLFGFIDYARTAAARGLSSPALTGPELVNICSIHRSKGLEYPVVVLSDLSKKFNTDDFNKPVLIHKELGVGMFVRDSSLGIQYPSLPRAAIQTRLRAEQVAEEMRLLYVAMTRAREKLIMFCTADNYSASESTDSREWTPTTFDITRAKSLADWVLMTSGANDSVKPPWSTRVLPYDAPAELTAEPGDDSQPARSANPELVREIGEHLARSYRYAAAVDIPSKLTATGQVSRSDTEAPPVWSKPAISLIPSLLPDTQTSTLTGVERGNAFHTFMQLADFNLCSDALGIEQQIRSLAERDLLTPAEAAAINVTHIERFFDSDIGRRLTASRRIERERRFSLLVPAMELTDAPESCDEQILLQGSIDCVFWEDDELVILDFKTDRVKPGGDRERAEHYKPQLSAYRIAAARVYDMNVRSAALYFFNTGYTHFF